MRAMHGQAFPLVNAPDEANNKNNSSNNTTKVAPTKHEPTDTNKKTSSKSSRKAAAATIALPTMLPATSPPPFYPFLTPPCPPAISTKWEQVERARTTEKVDDEIQEERKRRGRQSNYQKLS